MPEHKIEDAEQQILTIMQGFKFDRVLKAMRATDWKYADHFQKDPSKELYEPSIYDLKVVAHGLLQDAAKDSLYHATGGFEAMVEDGILHLSFVLETTGGNE